MFIDSHAHLEFDEYAADFSQVLERAKSAQIEAILNIGTSVEHSKKTVALASQYPHIFAAIGIHPHDGKDTPDHYLDILKELARKPKVVAIGEIGLDYFYKHSTPDIQKQRFEEQVCLAKELNLPISIHCREAFQNIIDILNRSQYFKGVFHCFTGSLAEAKKALDMGFYISISGIVTFKKSTVLQEVVKELPLEKMLIETDAPFLAPEPNRGKRNEPAFVVQTAKKIAELKHIPLEEVAKVTTQNTKKLFGLLSSYV
ncbi:MAG: hydrolase TatD [Deltaproteobacteria bacterium RIFCSPLOWO2_01_FULL_38_9]|nr:MAG: hydrolase TatD [Deltaproteobacteria bacterium RIFCSPLOWO2_01_FULL_38_9]